MKNGQIFPLNVNVMKLRIFKTHLKIYFPLLYLAITKRGGICILKICLWAYITYEDHHSL